MTVVTKTVPSGTESKGSGLPSTGGRLCHLVFTTREPLENPGILVRDHIRTVWPDHLIGPYSVQEYCETTREGFYVSQVTFELPLGEEFASTDCLSLETFRTSEGRMKLAGYLGGQSFPLGAILLLEQQIYRLLVADSFALQVLDQGLEALGPEPGEGLSQLVVDMIHIFTDSITSVTSGGCNQYSVDGSTEQIG